MRLFLLTQDTHNDYDVFYGMLVCAESPDEAVKISCDYASPETWVKSEDVKVREIGIAHDDLKKGIVIKDYNAG